MPSRLDTAAGTGEDVAGPDSGPIEHGGPPGFNPATSPPPACALARLRLDSDSGADSARGRTGRRRQGWPAAGSRSEPTRPPPPRSPHSASEPATGGDSMSETLSGAAGAQWRDADKPALINGPATDDVDPAASHAEARKATGTQQRVAGCGVVMRTRSGGGWDQGEGEDLHHADGGEGQGQQTAPLLMRKKGNTVIKRFMHRLETERDTKIDVDIEREVKRGWHMRREECVAGVRGVILLLSVLCSGSSAMHSALPPRHPLSARRRPLQLLDSG